MGQTPFHLACEGRNTEIIECLLRHDPEIMELDRLDDNGNTFWHLVARTDAFFDYVKRVDLAENLEIKNNFGQTPLHMSVMHDFLSVTEFLLERGHDPNLFDKDGNTPLHFAVQLNDSCSIDILVKNGANINARNNNLETPLHKAINFRDNFSVEELLRRGADVNSQDIEGNTPLHLEIKTGDRNIDIREEWWDIDPSSGIWKTLLKFGANPNIRNNKGETAMDTAKSLDKKNFLQHIFSRP